MPLLLVAAVVLSVFALQTKSAPRPRSTDALATPVWSARRAPQPLVYATGGQQLQAALSTAIGPSACVTVDVGGLAVAGRDSATPILGASTQKLLTAAAALDALGPDTVFETRVVAPAAPNGGLVDRVWLVGGGDPTLTSAEYGAYLQTRVETRDVTTTTSLESLADAVVAQGVRRVPGGILGDDSRYDTQRYLPTWRDTYRTEGTIGPLGALTVNDGFSTWTPSRAPSTDPALNAATELTRLLRARGVEVGPPGRGTAPATSFVVATAKSAPLRELVTSMLRSSDNLAAELLVKELGVKLAKDGSTAAGVHALGERLTALGIPLDGVMLVDGSGLDRGNRITCQALSSVLALSARPEFAALGSGLPVAGRSGTLADRLKGTPLDGQLRAKTGSLQGVTALAGFLDGAWPVRFAFVANGDFSETAGYTLPREDRRDRGELPAVATGRHAGPGAGIARRTERVRRRAGWERLTSARRRSFLPSGAWTRDPCNSARRRPQSCADPRSTHGEDIPRHVERPHPAAAAARERALGPGASLRAPTDDRPAETARPLRRVRHPRLAAVRDRGAAPRRRLPAPAPDGDRDHLYGRLVLRAVSHRGRRPVRGRWPHLAGAAPGPDLPGAAMSTYDRTVTRADIEAKLGEIKQVADTGAASAGKAGKGAAVAAGMVGVVLAYALGRRRGRKRRMFVEIVRV